MNLQWAQDVALEVVGYLEPECERVVMAGSVRRQTPEVKDLEIVYLSKEIPMQTLFEGVGDTYAGADVAIDDMVAAGVLAWDREMKRNGPRYKRLIHVESGLVVELFRAFPDNWGYILALRTGPSEFNKIWASHPWHGGILPVDYKLAHGYVWHLGQKVAIPDEATFFELLGLPCWAPEARSEERFRRWVVERRRGEK